MNIYFADTNIFVRFFLKDDPELTKKAKIYLSRAKNGQIKIIVVPEIILEIEYALRRVYKLNREEITSHLLSLIKAYYIDVQEKTLWIAALELYSKTNIDLIDILIFVKAKREDAEVLSFDEDFRKLKELS